MAKFKMELVKSVREEKKKQQEQEALHKKHKIQDDGIVVVEKSNMVKFTVRTMTRLVRLAAVILLFALATVGLFALVYPDIRGEFLGQLHSTLGDIQRLTGF